MENLSTIACAIIGAVIGCYIYRKWIGPFLFPHQYKK